MFWTFQNIRIGLRTNTKVAANEYEVIRINTVLCDAQRMPIRIGSQTTFATVGRGHKSDSADHCCGCGIWGSSWCWVYIWISIITLCQIKYNYDNIFMALNSDEAAIGSILTHRGGVMHICVGNLTIIGSDNGLSPGQCQAIIWTNVGISSISSIGSWGTNCNEILSKFIHFHSRKCIWNSHLANGGLLPQPQCVKHWLS